MLFFLLFNVLDIKSRRKKDERESVEKEKLIVEK
jgi:hypothetical protein